MNLTKLSDEELYEIIGKSYDCIAEANKELNKYRIVACTVCGTEEIVFRNEDLPFVTWTRQGDCPLCPFCTWKFKNGLPEEYTVSPVDEIMALLD